MAAQLISREPKCVSKYCSISLAQSTCRLTIDLKSLPQHKDIDAPSKPHVPKYLPNPEEHWGPKARATGKRHANPADGDEEAKKKGKSEENAEPEGKDN